MQRSSLRTKRGGTSIQKVYGDSLVKYLSRIVSRYSIIRDCYINVPTDTQVRSYVSTQSTKLFNCKHVLSCFKRGLTYNENSKNLFYGMCILELKEEIIHINMTVGIFHSTVPQLISICLVQTIQTKSNHCILFPVTLDSTLDSPAGYH